MSQETITALLNLLAVLMPLVEKGALALYADIATLINDATASPNVTPEQLVALKAAATASDAAQDKAYSDFMAAAKAAGKA